MEYLKCNRLSCRTPLRETAVVTTCSHCFCVSCANNLFGNGQICPACSASLTEPDDVVVCSLQPTNDYKTSVLSGLSPAIILQICERAISFWEYQSRQESAFQQAVLKNVNDKSAQAQKQLDNVIREAKSEIGLLNDKINGLERELELERRKNKEAQEHLREKDREYTKLRNQYDQLKKKALFAPSATAQSTLNTFAAGDPPAAQESINATRVRSGAAGLSGFAYNIEDVVESMEAVQVQRTPFRSVANTNFEGGSNHTQWNPQVSANRIPGSVQRTNRFHAAPGASSATAALGPSFSASDGHLNGSGIRRRRGGSDGNGSDSSNEREGLVGAGVGGSERTAHRVQVNPTNSLNPNPTNSGFGTGRLQQSVTRPAQRSFSFGQSVPKAPAPHQTQRKSGTFRPAPFNR